jgi:hypothetical protein
VEKTRRKINDMAEAIYSDPEVCAAVIADAERLGTVDAIEDGSRTLPSELDATMWHDGTAARESDKERARRR